MSGPKCGEITLSQQLILEQKRKHDEEVRKRNEELLRMLGSCKSEKEKIDISFSQMQQNGDFDWLEDKSIKNQINEEIKKIESFINLMNVDSANKLINELNKKFERLITGANENRSKDSLRAKKVDILVDTLREMGYGANTKEINEDLGDSNSPISDVVITAEKSSGGKIIVSLTLENKITVDADDLEIKGSTGDCVEELKKIIESVKNKGANMKINDWGKANPNREKNITTKINTTTKTNIRLK